MKVYIVSKGESHQGSSVYCVFSDKDNAIDWVEAYVSEQSAQNGISWYLDETHQDIWWDEGEVFYIEIQEFVIQDS